jgi:GNAT superfamily N-acetyltransferase
VQVIRATLPDSQSILDMIYLKAEFDGKMRGSPFLVSTTLEKIQHTLFSVKPLAHVLLLKQGQETIGFALYYLRYSSFLGLSSLWLDDLFISSAARSQGGGAMLMQAVIEEGQVIGASHLAWGVSITNIRGQQFYKKFKAKFEGRDESLIYYKLPITVCS